MRTVALCFVAFLAIAAATSAPPPQAEPEDTELTIFDARGGHTTSEKLRQCYDLLRRVASCPMSQKKLGDKTIIGTERKPLVCKAADVDGTHIIKITLMLLRSISKEKFVKNAYFTGVVGGKKPDNQHMVDVFVGQVVYNILNAADAGGIARLTGPAKTAFEQLSLANEMWASAKFGKIFKSTKERISMSSTEFRRNIKLVRESPGVLFNICRRAKFMLASMDVGADVSKYALEKKITIMKIINKIVSTGLKMASGAIPIGGSAVASVVSAVSEMVDGMIDSAKAKADRKYAVSDILLQIFQGFIPAKSEGPTTESMLTAQAQQSTEIIRMLRDVQAKLGVTRTRRGPPRPKVAPPTTPTEPKKSSSSSSSSSKSSSSSSSSSKKSPKFMSRRHNTFDALQAELKAMSLYRFQEVDPVFLMEQQVEIPDDMFGTVKYDTGAECDNKVKALLYLIESMYEDVPASPVDVVAKNGGTTDVYTDVDTCGPNPSIMSEKENVLRAKAIFKLLKYFVNVPDASSVEAETWLANIANTANNVIDKVAEGIETVQSLAGGGDSQEEEA